MEYQLLAETINMQIVSPTMANEGLPRPVVLKNDSMVATCVRTKEKTLAAIRFQYDKVTRHIVSLGLEFGSTRK